MKPSSKRILIGVLVAVVLAVSAGHLYANDGIWQALCAGFAKESPEWYLFGCYLLP